MLFIIIKSYKIPLKFQAVLKYAGIIKKQEAVKMKLKCMYVDDLLKVYPYSGDFFEEFGLKLKSEHIKLQQYLEGLKKDFFDEIGIEKITIDRAFSIFYHEHRKI